MYIREISTFNIKDIINYPDFTEIQNNGKILKVKYIQNKGKVAVVYRRVGSEFIIITVYYED
jgi:hypothetical protein